MKSPGHPKEKGTSGCKLPIVCCRISIVSFVHALLQVSVVLCSTLRRAPKLKYHCRRPRLLPNGAFCLVHVVHPFDECMRKRTDSGRPPQNDGPEKLSAASAESKELRHDLEEYRC